MATILETLKLVKKWHYRKLNPKSKDFIDKMIEGLDGLGDINDTQVGDYISPGQEKFVRDLGAKFLITKNTKIERRQIMGRTKGSKNKPKPGKETLK